MALEEFIEVGRIVTTQGLSGEVRVQPWCDDPAFLAALPVLHVGTPGETRAVEGARVQKNVVVLKLKGSDTVEAAALLRGKTLYLPRAEIPLGDGEYLIADLIGCGVFDALDGGKYGDLCDVTHTGANDVWHIRFPGGAEKLIPVIPQVVRRVDVAGRRVEITPLEGLFDL